MRKLIRERFDLWVRMRWLKQIDREYKKLQRYQRKYNHHSFVFKALNTRYDELYGERKEVSG